MIGTILRAIGFFLISALLLGQGVLIVWESFGWPVTVLGIIATLVGAGLWGAIIMEGLGQLRPADPEVPSWAPLLTFAAAIIPFYLAGGFGELGDHAIGPWLVGLAGQFGMVALIIAIRRWRAQA
jgi:uncharacterized membrane protein YraQ (UPF0718 family)